jgi:hypothetical protein
MKPLAKGLVGKLGNMLVSFIRWIKNTIANFPTDLLNMQSKLHGLIALFNPDDPVAKLDINSKF